MLILQDRDAIASIAQIVYAQVFAQRRPPVHALLRDYARGTVLRAQSVGADLGKIELDATAPPYESPWPVSAASEQQLEKRFPRDKWGSVWGSVGDWGDFHRYKIEPAVRHFLAPNQKERKRRRKRDALRRANESWEKFIKTLSKKQRRLIIGSNIDWQMVTANLTPEQNDELDRVAREFDSARSYDHPVTFDLDRASRRSLTRVARLGWTPERFGDFDRMMSYNDASQTSHKAERIGKKYQWIALNELVARISDHCAMQDAWRGAKDRYEGSWQIWLRDTDPSLAPKHQGALVGDNF